MKDRVYVRTTSTARLVLGLADDSPERKLGGDAAVLKVFVALTGKDRVTPVFVHTWRIRTTNKSSP